jgi:hypothetical protein
VSATNVCAVLGCGRIAPTTYIAAEDGELAGWAWKRGDALHFCWPHARNLYRGRDPLWEDGMPSGVRG